MRLLALLLTLTLLSCANDMNVKNFETETPKFVLEDYFDGKTKAWGMFHDRFGNLTLLMEVNHLGVKSMSSTSKMRVALGGMTPPAPLAP